MTTVRQAIFAGLFRTSGLSLTMAISTLLVCVASYHIWVTPELIIRLAPTLASEHGDQNASLTRNVLTLKKNENSLQTVYLVGDSALKEGLDLNILDDTLNRGDKSIQIENLLSGGQSILEGMAVIDNIPLSAKGVVVLGHSVRKLHVTPPQIEVAQRGSRRGFSSVAVTEFLSDIEHPTSPHYGLYSLDSFWFTAPRLWKLFTTKLNSESHTEKHSQGLLQKMTPAEFSRSTELYMMGIQKPYKKHQELQAHGRDALLKIQHLVSQRQNLELLIIESPINPAIVRNNLGTDFYKKHLDNIRLFCELNNLNYRNTAAKADLNEFDFADVLHLSDHSAILKHTEALASTVDDFLHD